ncbi:MAG: hypothetical protein CMQ43_08270 [Gammaproteobacteria bacterium]|nr:hypothetical protein [Gammaproteobacteria bacterium]
MIGIARIWLLGVLIGLAGGAHGAASEPPAGDPPAGERFVDVWGPALGTALPLLDAVDQAGERRRLENLAGQRGLLLFLVRSADW